MHTTRIRTYTHTRTHLHATLTQKYTHSHIDGTSLFCVIVSLLHLEALGLYLMKCCTCLALPSPLLPLHPVHTTPYFLSSIFFALVPLNWWNSWDIFIKIFSSEIDFRGKLDWPLKFPEKFQGLVNWLEKHEVFGRLLRIFPALRNISQSVLACGKVTVGMGFWVFPSNFL